jgi:hypothetical protein
MCLVMDTLALQYGGGADGRQAPKDVVEWEVLGLQNFVKVTVHSYIMVNS